MKKDGFTLLEVMLFMAISSSLAFIAFVSIGPRLRNVRFTDSVRGLESSVNGVVNSDLSGTSSRPEVEDCFRFLDKVGFKNGAGSTTGTAEKCVSNGIVAIFGKNSIVYRQIASLSTPHCAPSNLEKIIECYNATILSSTEDPGYKTYNYTWGMEKVGSNNDTALVILRDPNSQAIYRFQTTALLGGAYKGALSATRNFENVLDPNNSFDVCYAAGIRKAKFTFSNNSEAVVAKFNEACS